MADDLNATVNEAIEQGKQDYKETVKNDFEPVKNQAQQFINAYDSYSILQKSFSDNYSSIFQQMADIASKSNNNNVSKTDITYRRDKQVLLNSLKEAYKLGFDFQKKYQNFLGQAPTEIIYVTNSGQMYKGEITDVLSKVYFEINTKGQAVGRIGNLSKVFTEIEDINENLKNAYNGIMEQMSVYYDKLQKVVDEKEKNAVNEKQREQIHKKYYTRKEQFIRQVAFIKDNDKYLRILNYGDLAEAFAAVWYDIKNNSNLTEEELRKKILEAVQNVSNKGIIYGEDVGNYAIKKSGAALPELTQLKKIAVEAVNGEGPFKEYMTALNKTGEQNEKERKGIRNIILTHEKLQQPILPEGFGENYTLQNLLEDVDKVVLPS